MLTTDQLNTIDRQKLIMRKMMICEDIEHVISDIENIVDSPEVVIIKQEIFSIRNQHAKDQ